MKKVSLLFAIAILFTVPALALADCGSCNHKMDGGQKMAATHEGHGDMDHSKMEHGSQGMHDNMSAAGGMIMLGEQSMHGVKAMAHMKDVGAAMSKMGMKTTHHFMVMFNDEKSGKPIESGKVAVKITSPDGTVGEPLELMGMQGHFGADVTLDKPGKYAFQVGTKLADGEARQFSFSTTLK